ncbi:hypothetical protein [Nocardia sp. IFM 10818]
MLWYVIQGDRSMEYNLDRDRFAQGKWWDIDMYAIPYSVPEFVRFLHTLDAAMRRAE